MGKLISFLLVTLAVLLFVAVQKGWVSESKIQLLANIAGIIALLAAIAVFLFPSSQSNSKVGRNSQQLTSQKPDSSSENISVQNVTNPVKDDSLRQQEANISEVLSSVVPSGHESSKTDANYQVKVFKGITDQDKVAIDTANKLMWSQMRIIDVVSPLDRILNELDGMNLRGFAGHNDWRLPTLKEAETLIGRKRVIGEKPPGIKRFSYLPSHFLHPEVNHINSIWTSDFNQDKTKAWIVDFINGSGKLSSKSAHSARLIAVREYK